ncbi:hypothetical protein C8Q80DRAFT_521998 [Daedaleopsis nitida]|nr:hypothetical protein C8Q80DRAFT_521998 [Daedaleopsis nitida]
MMVRLLLGCCSYRVVRAVVELAVNTLSLSNGHLVRLLFCRVHHRSSGTQPSEMFLAVQARVRSHTHRHRVQSQQSTNTVVLVARCV